MRIYNAEIAKMFNKLADLLEIEGANPFRIRAYRNAALVINNLSRNVADLVEENVDLTELPHIGTDLAEKLKTIVKTGELPALKEIEKRVPAILSQLMTVGALGPKRVKALYEQLNVRSMNDLKRAIDKGDLRKLHGFGEKIEQKIKESIGHVTEYQKRFKLAEAMKIAEPLAKYLREIKGVKKVEVAGSFRRRKETVGDLDIVVVAPPSAKVIHHFVNYSEVIEVISEGSTRSTVRLNSGMQVDLRVVPAENFGAASLYFTGSKAHNIFLRRMAQQKKWKINEYGVFKDEKYLAGKTEEGMYKKLGLPYIEPELREDNGEIEAALVGKLPKRLVELKDIRGDLHSHTDATDGTDTLEAMAKAAAKLGYEYLAITDHSVRLTVANGLDKTRLLKQIKAIDKLNEKLNNIVILKGIEVDILEDGSLDLPDDVLKQLDLTVCSIHSRFGLNRKKQTERIIRAMDNLYFNILGHPTGRLIGEREPYDIDLEAIMQAAKQRNCFLELNAQPARLDLNEIYGKLAKEIDVKVAISSDAHSISQLSNMQYGVFQARRGWLEEKEILNTNNLSGLRKLLKRR